MPTPIDRKIFEGEIATYWFYEGILVSLSKSVRRTVENIRGNVALKKNHTQQKNSVVNIFKELADAR